MSIIPQNNQVVQLPRTLAALLAEPRNRLSRIKAEQWPLSDNDRVELLNAIEQVQRVREGVRHANR